MSNLSKDVLSKLVAACPWQELPPNPKHPGRIEFTTGPARLAFAWIEKPKPNERGKPKFQACFILPPETNLEFISSVIQRTATPVFGADYANPAMRLNFPFKLQSGLAVQKKPDGSPKYKGFADSGVFLSADSLFAPPVWNQSRTEKLDVARDKGFVYSGMWVRAVMHAYTYQPSAKNPQSTKGIGFGFSEIQKLADDEELRGEGAGSRFGAVEGIVPHQAPAAMPGLGALPGM